MKVYTRTGDNGETALFSGGRVSKRHHRIEAYGTVDELVSVLGLLRCEPVPADVDERLVAIQNSLFAVGAALADPRGRLEHDVCAWDVKAIEGWIDAMDEELDPLHAFILPGGSRAAALAHVARTVCRRAERRVNVVADEAGGVPEGVLPYLNRLSDALFMLARLINARGGVPETEWSAKTQR